MATIKVFKGDSTIVKEFTIDGIDTLDSNWTGKKVVRADLDTSPILEVELEKAADNSMFFGYLTPVETDAIPVGEYIVIYEIENQTLAPKFRREKHYKLKVQQHGIDT